ncbi:hypothetical protein HU200_029292 [Digitaria exilis]|uniref:Cytochrome P450 n=1 Tax=Digitaria exilis TaxID=1010633 RepID=A0A835BR17_9POAL|nr:hypothetical protein HU200_029292 [Digitaria exilis]
MEHHYYFLYLGLALILLLVVLAKRHRAATSAPPAPHRRQAHAVVLSSAEAAREVMKTHDLAATISELTNGGRDIILPPMANIGASVCRVLSFRRVREAEVAVMLRAVAAAVSTRHTIVDMRERLSVVVCDASARVVLGDRCKDRDMTLEQLELANQLTAGFNPAALWPSSWLARGLSSAVRRAKECQDKVFRIFDGIIKEHLDRMDSGQAREGEDLLHVLLKIQRDGELQIPLEMILVTLEWCLAELIRNPRAMECATAEVRHVFAPCGMVSKHGLTKLRYLHLVIQETLQLHPPLPLLLPRECQEPYRVLGYDVPRGIAVIVNAWALGRDECCWPGGDPEEFRPERFEEDGGEVDFKGTDFKMCLGVTFGLANVELPLASLLFHFDWVVPGVADLAQFDMTETFGQPPPPSPWPTYPCLVSSVLPLGARRLLALHMRCPDLKELILHCTACICMPAFRHSQPDPSACLLWAKLLGGNATRAAKID